MNEIWKHVPGYETKYAVSNLGRVKSIGKGSWKRVRKLFPRNTYLAVLLPSKDKKYKWHLVHKLVLEAFVGKRPPNCEARHKNRIVTDNRLDNLEWVPRDPNKPVKHKNMPPIRRGEEHHSFNKFGTNNPAAKSYIVTFPDGTEQIIRGLLAFSKEHGLDASAMSTLATGRRGYMSHKGFKCRYV